jgi:hypothetical protein
MSAKKANLSVPQTLTVAELVAALQRFPAEMRVNVVDPQGYTKAMTAKDMVLVTWPGKDNDQLTIRRA